MIRTLRVSEFMAKLTLKRHQRSLVPSFSKYQLEQLGKESIESAAPKEEEYSGIQDARQRSNMIYQAFDLFKNREGLN